MKCTCGVDFPSLKYLNNHLRFSRDAASKAGVKNTHLKVRTISYADAKAKGDVTKRDIKVRRRHFLDGG